MDLALLTGKAGLTQDASSWASLETDHCPVCSPRGAPSAAGNQIVKMPDM